METTAPTSDAEVAQEINLREMDEAVAALKELEAGYKEAKEVSDDWYNRLQAQKNHVMFLLERAGKTVYIAEGIARVKLTHEMSYQTPKTIEEKEAFFKWLAENEGEEVMKSYMTVNSQSLNSLLNDLEERYAREGKILAPEGLGAPIARAKLSVTKA